MTIVANPAVEPVSLQQQTTRKSDFVNKAPADPETLHELVFAVKQQNIELLDSMLIERSTPGSQVYQQWMTHEEVGNITSNLEASHAVIDWLEQSEVEVLWTSLRLEYIKAVAKISKWDELLSAEFSVIDTPKRQSKRARTENKKAPLLHRTKVYNLPSEIKHHIQAVFSAVESPAIESSKPDIKPTTEALPVESQVGRKLNNLRTNNANAATAMKVVLDGTVTIPFLNQLYKIPANIGDATQQQMVFETNEEMYAPADLELFQQHFNLPSQTVVDHSPSPHSTTDCVNQTCAQSNADLQYLTGMAQGTRTEYFYAPAVGSTDPFVAWITSVADMEEPPLVHSITWSIPERVSILKYNFITS